MKPLNSRRCPRLVSCSLSSGAFFSPLWVLGRRGYTWPRRRRRSPEAWACFFTQLAFNFLWTIIFFNLQAFDFAFFWLLALWGLILWMIISFYKVDKPAAWLQVPYLLWVAFAGYLNLGGMAAKLIAQVLG